MTLIYKEQFIITYLMGQYSYLFILVICERIIVRRGEQINDTIEMDRDEVE